jgi:hypothetical protein
VLCVCGDLREGAVVAIERRGGAAGANPTVQNGREANSSGTLVGDSSQPGLADSLAEEPERQVGPPRTAAYCCPPGALFSGLVACPSRRQSNGPHRPNRRPIGAQIDQMHVANMSPTNAVRSASDCS